MSVHFNTTLFALVRESLSIKMRPASATQWTGNLAVDRLRATYELRRQMRRVWPYYAREMLNLVVPLELESDDMTIGQLLSGRMVAENWRKFAAERSAARKMSEVDDRDRQGEEEEEEEVRWEGGGVNRGFEESEDDESRRSSTRESSEESDYEEEGQNKGRRKKMDEEEEEVRAEVKPTGMAATGSFLRTVGNYLALTPNIFASTP